MNVNGRIMNTLMYADDVVILSESKEDLQRLLDTVSEYARDFNVKFSSEKSQVLVVSGDETDNNCTWMLGGMTIKRTKSIGILECW